MAATLKAFSDTFWNVQFWLPTGYNWNDLKPESKDVYYPRVQDINWSIGVGVVLLILRYVYERVLIVPLANLLGVRERKTLPVPPNATLEKAYKDHRGRPTQSDLELLSKKTELSIRQVERWFFKRKLRDAPSSLVKFRECSWHFLFYFSAFVYGVWILWDRKWFWETKLCYVDYPLQHVDTPLYLFYLIELGFYWSLLLSSLTDVKRTDFWEMTTHHLITIALIYFSWVTNFVRIGALIIVVHDVSDYWMAAAKMAKYSKRQTLCEALFTCFILIWIISRMVIYPFWIVNSVIFEIPEYLPPFTSHIMFIVLLCGLQILHTFWTYLILRIALQKFTHGELQKDVRSDSDSIGELSDSESETDGKVLNGTNNLKARNNNIMYKARS